ncbi:MAG: hypothetical protein OSJ61_21280 [Lachnospiraceae bacterium]|nr:hypothetical protein [Lachnospiraceae bacterium]
MDKLAQKFSAQEIIKANSQAEAEEMKRLQLQVAEYEKILQEMRKLNYRNAELSEKLDYMIGDNADKIQGMKEEEQRLVAALKDLTDEQTRNREAELERMEAERAERERIERERAERERIEQERAEAERAERERIEQERAKQARIERERIEQERIERERAEQERAERERIERERIEQERIERERAEQERAERERIERERIEQERIEREHAEQERAERERIERERIEQERIEQVRAEQERIEQERIERERAEAEQRRAELSVITELLESKFQKSDDFVHKENVKVYRNVQAVVVDEIKRSIESAQGERAALKDELKKELDGKLNKVMALCVLSTIVSVASIVLWVVQAMGLLG